MRSRRMQKKYDLLYKRAQDAFRHRLHQVEIELAEAQLTLEKLDLQVQASERRQALVMSQDLRLGKDSPLNLLPNELVLAIVLEAEKP